MKTKHQSRPNSPRVVRKLPSKDTSKDSIDAQKESSKQDQNEPNQVDIDVEPQPSLASDTGAEPARDKKVISNTQVTAAAVTLDSDNDTASTTVVNKVRKTQADHEREADEEIEALLADDDNDNANTSVGSVGSENLDDLDLGSDMDLGLGLSESDLADLGLSD